MYWIYTAHAASSVLILYLYFVIFHVQLDPENVEALVSLAILDLQTNEGGLVIFSFICLSR
jgi:hypothetical protein